MGRQREALDKCGAAIRDASPALHEPDWDGLPESLCQDFAEIQPTEIQPTPRGAVFRA